MKSKYLFTFFLSIIVVIAFIPVTQANAINYNPSAAISYAKQYWNNYNPNYPNCNPIGGDCANFVSQCLYAGGLEQNNEWKVGSAAWQSCPSMYNYFRNSGYQIIENPTDNQLIAGNPILYYSSAKGRWSHAAICIGHNSSGSARIAAHNTDHYDVDWKLGSSWTKRCTIIINGTQPDIVKPIISTDKSSYIVGDTVNISWTPSPAGSNLSHYWLQIDGPDGWYPYAGTMNLDTSYSFVASKVGDYTIKTYATPKGSKDGEGSLTDVKTISVTNPIPAPTYSNLTANKTMIAIGEEITFTASSDYATGFTIGIDNETSRYLTQEMPNGQLTLTFDNPGNYGAYVTSYNSVGYADSSWIAFTVYDKIPTYSNLTANKTMIAVGEEITFSASSDLAIGYTIGIDNEKERYLTQGMENGNLTITFDKAGSYGAYVTSYNSIGYVDSSWISFTVYDSPPTFSSISIDKEIYAVNDKINFNFDSDNGIWYSVGIYKNGERYDSIWDVADKNYTYQVHEPGKYSAYVTSRNLLGWIESERIEFTVIKPGDVNNDGKFNVADAVILQKWLLAEPNAELVNWKAADLCEDDRLDVFDMIEMRKLIINSQSAQ